MQEQILDRSVKPRDAVRSEEGVVAGVAVRQLQQTAVIALHKGSPAAEIPAAVGKIAVVIAGELLEKCVVEGALSAGGDDLGKPAMGGSGSRKG